MSYMDRDDHNKNMSLFLSKSATQDDRVVLINQIICLNLLVCLLHTLYLFITSSLVGNNHGGVVLVRPR